MLSFQRPKIPIDGFKWWVFLCVCFFSSVLFLEKAVNSHFKFTLHTFLIDFCLSRASGICQVSINKLERI